MAGNSPGFLGGITILVTCGYGRAVTATLTRELPTNWRLESLAAIRSGYPQLAAGL